MFQRASWTKQFTVSKRNQKLYDELALASIDINADMFGDEEIDELRRLFANEAQEE